MEFNKIIYFENQLPVNGTLLPVMFWIHGGAFSLGQAVEYIPTRYMDHDIVLVVIQYRLGPLGQLMDVVSHLNQK